MREDWRFNRRYHLYKSASGRYCLSDKESKQDRWTLYEENFSSYQLKITAMGIAVQDAWIYDIDFTEDEKAKLSEAMLDGRQDTEKEM